MTAYEALDLILELASDNALTEHEAKSNVSDDCLRVEYLRQQEAFRLVCELQAKLKESDNV